MQGFRSNRKQNKGFNYPGIQNQGFNYPALNQQQQNYFNEEEFYPENDLADYRPVDELQDIYQLPDLVPLNFSNSIAKDLRGRTLEITRELAGYFQERIRTYDEEQVRRWEFRLPETIFPKTPITFKANYFSQRNQYSQLKSRYNEGLSNLKTNLKKHNYVLQNQQERIFQNSNFKFEDLWSYDEALNKEINYIMEEEYNNIVNQQYPEKQANNLEENEGLPLTQQQYDQIWRTGQFDDPSKVFPGQKYVWQLHRILIRGSENNVKDWHWCLSCAYDQLLEIPKRFFQKKNARFQLCLWNGMTGIYDFFKQIAHMLIGINLYKDVTISWPTYFSQIAREKKIQTIAEQGKNNLPLDAYKAFLQKENQLRQLEKQFYQNVWTKQYVKEIESKMPNDENFLINLQNEQYKMFWKFIAEKFNEPLLKNQLINFLKSQKIQ